MKFPTVAFVSALALSAFASRADASVVIDVTQVGADVVAAGSGAFDLTDLTMGSGLSMGSGLAAPALGVLLLGTDALFDAYFQTSGPSSFGSGSGTFGSSALGDGFGLGIFHSLFVPQGYVSGTELSGSTTFDGQTIASLGFDPGTYVYTWGAGDQPIACRSISGRFLNHQPGQ
jgi:hypothetical protein